MSCEYEIDELQKTMNTLVNDLRKEIADRDELISVLEDRIDQSERKVRKC